VPEQVDGVRTKRTKSHAEKVHAGGHLSPAPDGKIRIHLGKTATEEPEREEAPFAALTPDEEAARQRLWDAANNAQFDVGTKCFWTGGGEAVAEAFAPQVGGTTNTQTELCKGMNADWDAFLQPAIDRGAADWKDLKPIWQTTSGKFAEAASGTVHAFVEDTRNKGSIFVDTELPRLIDNPKVDSIIFYKNDGTPAGTWSRDASGHWHGDDVSFNDLFTFTLGDFQP
jgi:hypothetical protein